METQNDTATLHHCLNNKPLFSTAWQTTCAVSRRTLNPIVERCLGPSRRDTDLGFCLWLEVNRRRRVSHVKHPHRSVVMHMPWPGKPLPWTHRTRRWRSSPICSRVLASAYRQPRLAVCYFPSGTFQLRINHLRLSCIQSLQCNTQCMWLQGLSYSFNQTKLQ